jgi:hypothetical protein
MPETDAPTHTNVSYLSASKQNLPVPASWIGGKIKKGERFVVKCYIFFSKSRPDHSDKAAKALQKRAHPVFAYLMFLSDEFDFCFV